MRGFYLLFGFSFLLLASSFRVRANNNGAETEIERKVFIVYMGKTSTLDGATRRTDHAQLLSEIRKRREKSVVQIYSKSFLGFAARLPEEEAKSIAQRPGVVSVFQDRVIHLDTTHSWDFLMSQNAASKVKDPTSPTSSPPLSNWPNNGADTIIGIIDTGIWPEHPSFNDKYMGPIPLRWKGVCQAGKNSSYSFKCNKKVIGARYYDDPDDPGYINSARDDHGHGSHVASIAAGKPVWGASYYGLAKGVARGGSPGSRIAVYHVCGADGGCVSQAILKAIDDAIADGVDVISISMNGYNGDLLSDPFAIGAFHAAQKGITVVCSAGNGGPSPGTLDSFAPWILTVGATTTDRDFEADIVLIGGNKKNIIIKGGGINLSGQNKSSAIYPLVYGYSAASNQSDVAKARNCIPGSLDDSKVKGKTVLCEDEDNNFNLFEEKFITLRKQGATGMILINDNFRQDPQYFDSTPVFAAVTEKDGAQIKSYINSTRNPLATILPTKVILNNKPAPVVPRFSARGPKKGVENLIKPDVAAPGVSIIAAWLSFGGNASEPNFNLDSGTSQACPHVSGLAATVKSWHPTWSPSAIKSAIMTTAIPTNNLHAPITTITGSRATPFDIGAGEISLLGPLCPGLVYETEITDYVQFLCNMGYNASVVKSIASTVSNDFSCPSDSSSDLISDMNYPSIAVSCLDDNGRTVKRTVSNVGEEYSTYTATVEAPAGLQVQVVPNKLEFTKKVKKLSFQVIFKLTKAYKEPLFGSISWSNGEHKIRSPFAITQA